MMKYIYDQLKSVFFSKKSKQQELIDFIENRKNVEAAVEGSMQKRLDLIERVELKERHI